MLTQIQKFPYLSKIIKLSFFLLQTPTQLIIFPYFPLQVHMSHNRPLANFLKQYIRFPLTKKLINAQPTPQNITIPDIHKFCQKITRLRKQPHNIQLITDYDHTLTKYKHENLKCDALFGMWANNSQLPAKFRQQLINNYLLYGPYQTDGTISFLEKYELINQFYIVQTRLFQNHRITAQMAQQTVDNAKLIFRPYSKRFFEVLAEGGIPTYIISGGISDIIYTTVHELCQKVEANISIHSNQLEMYQIDKTNGGHRKVDYNTAQFWNAINHRKLNENILDKSENKTQHQDRDSYLIKFKSPLIHSYNKFQIMRNHTSKRKHCILMGDLVSDIYMARGVNYDTILSVFYAKEGQTDQRAIAEEKFDLIVQSDGSHKIVVELIKIILGKKNINWEYLSSVHNNLHQYLI